MARSILSLSGNPLLKRKTVIVVSRVSLPARYMWPFPARTVSLNMREMVPVTRPSSAFFQNFVKSLSKL